MYAYNASSVEGRSHIMKKAGMLFLLVTALCMLLTVSGFASTEPAAQSSDFSLTVLVNGEEYSSVTVNATVEGAAYTFDLSDLMEAVGVQLEYDEQTDTATITPAGDGLTSALLSSVEEKPLRSDAAPVLKAPKSLRSNTSVRQPAVQKSQSFAKEAKPLKAPSVLKALPVLKAPASKYDLKNHLLK